MKYVLMLCFLWSSPTLAAKPSETPSQLPQKILKSNEFQNLLADQQPVSEPKARKRRRRLRTLKSFDKTDLKIAPTSKAPMIFDLPVTYNPRVRKWISYFQGSGKNWFKKWLERSHRFVPGIQKILVREGLPKDLVYVAMIESGFSSYAVSSAAAVGPWQFIKSTGNQYGLRTKWWIDERRDFEKSTHSAAQYFKYLYKMFDSWYLAAAAYNMGENRLKRLIRRYKTSDYWGLSMKPRFAKETQDYVPKLMAAILISKAPKLYGFRDLNVHIPDQYEYVEVPGGTDLINLADALNVTRKHLKSINPELLQGFIPKHIHKHRIRVPLGASQAAIKFAKRNTKPHFMRTAARSNHHRK